jgi:hypothetical protein
MTTFIRYIQIELVATNQTAHASDI